METLVLITLIRLLTPLLLFIIPPLPAIIGYLIPEAFDWYILPLHSESDYLFYQSWDKYMDTAFILTALIYALKQWREYLAKKTLTLLSIYRITGVLLFETTGWRLFLFMFPNLFDLFFVFYTLHQEVTHHAPLFTSTKKIVNTLCILLIPKLFQEYFIHWRHQLPWQIPSLSLHLFHSPLDTISTRVLWLLLYTAIPAYALYSVKIRPNS